MNSRDTGGSAFPHQGTSNGETFVRPSPGMGIRDYMATHVELGEFQISINTGEILTGVPYPKDEPLVTILRWWADCRAMLRYIEADAMLAARAHRTKAAIGSNTTSTTSTTSSSTPGA